ncbi:MAG: hypothetical protein M1814_005701 [Vezdaea aestivalis]|nr:MAG: hypothetical protein M1814_005701 [Vezdaea aestivalis]
MSRLERELASFNSDMAAASTRIELKVAVPSKPSQNFEAALAEANKKRRDDKEKKPDQVYSQPADTGTGTHIMTQVTYSIQRLKELERPLQFSEIADYLSLRQDQAQRNLARILKRHDRITWTADSSNPKLWNGGTFTFRPLHPVRSATELLAYLQKRKSAQGLSVKELKEGWSGAIAAIDLLEAQHRILVVRNKKDNHARILWPDDPTLYAPVDEDFQIIWGKIPLPKEADLAEELRKADLKPTGSAPKPKQAPKIKEKKQKKRRAGTKVTNSHMLGLLQTY